MAPIAPIALWGDAGSRLQLPNNERGLHFRSWCDRRKPIRQCFTVNSLTRWDSRLENTELPAWFDRPRTVVLSKN